MTGSSLGNFYNGALKDFDANQTSHIRVCVLDIFQYVNTD